MKPLRVLALTKYGRLGASSRMRTLQYLPWLALHGVKMDVRPMVSDAMLQARYDTGHYDKAALMAAYARRVGDLLGARAFDLLWIEKEALAWLPLPLERALLRAAPYVLDYDDATFHQYDLHTSPAVRRVYGRKLDGLMAGAALVVAGNGYLAQRATDAGAARVEVVPTVVNLERYDAAPALKVAGDGRASIVWIGSPSTARYLQTVAEPLRDLAARTPFVLRVIGGGDVQLPGVTTETMPWTEATEAQSLQGAAIGIMPLLDSPWERGKCGYKLIQYMACALPTVASAVGANQSIVLPGETGFLASSPQEWVQSLETLLRDPSLRQRMGAAGHARVEQRYCLQVTAPHLAQLLHQAARTESPHKEHAI